MAHELVVGIGSAHVRPDRDSRPYKRFVGVADSFSDGDYFVSNVSRRRHTSSILGVAARAGYVSTMSKHNVAATTLSAWSSTYSSHYGIARPGHGVVEDLTKDSRGQLRIPHVSNRGHARPC